MLEPATDAANAASARRRPKRKEKRAGDFIFFLLQSRVKNLVLRDHLLLLTLFLFFSFECDSTLLTPSFVFPSTPSLSLPRRSRAQGESLPVPEGSERYAQRLRGKSERVFFFLLHPSSSIGRMRVGNSPSLFSFSCSSFPLPMPSTSKMQMARRSSKQQKQLVLAALVAGAALFAASSAPHGALATFVSSSSSASSSSSSSSPQQQLLSAPSTLLNATTHKLELLVASLGRLSPPWLSQVVNEAARRTHGLKRAEEAKISSALGSKTPPPPQTTTTTTSPAALPYASPPPDAWLAADPCHAVPSPCADTAPFTLSEVRPARASASEGGGRLPAPAHLAPLTPTAPWSQVSGPGGEFFSFFPASFYCLR